MEILMFLHGFIVLFCYWWLKYMRPEVPGSRVKLPVFYLLSGLFLFFIALYAVVNAFSVKYEGQNWLNTSLLVLNICVFVWLPAGFLYLRKLLTGKNAGKKDLLHLLPLLVYIQFFAIPVQSVRGKSLFYMDVDRLYFVFYMYCITGVYTMKVAWLACKKYFSSLQQAPLNQEKINPLKIVTNSKTQPVDEVQVGTFHFSPEQIAVMDATVRGFLTTHKPFLKRGYSLRDLSADTSIPLHHLSAFINQYYQVHFNDFINEYRVQYCQVKIQNEEWRSKKLETIASESGFNNRNTFTAAFRKVTGCNPSDYLRLMKQQIKKIA